MVHAEFSINLAQRVMNFALTLPNWWRFVLAWLGCVLVVLWISATPTFADWINSWLEAQFPPVDVETLPQSDAAILLGGFGADLDNPANRMMHAWRLYRAGKARIIIITGGEKLA